MKYTKELLVEAIQRFYEEFGRVPISKDFEKLKGYPTRKTFTNHFPSFNDAVESAGFEPIYKEIDAKYRSEDYLLGLIDDYVKTFQETPTLDGISEHHGRKLRSDYRAVFGTWEEALSRKGLRAQSSQHSDEFLEEEFHSFVKKNGRIPRLQEFNASEYPSFWCYQNRFGSWNNAVIAYGYEPTDTNRKYTLDGGEVCASSYEYDISRYLKNKEIPYERNLNYIDFIDGYTGKMDCDYKITHKGKVW